MHADSVCRSAFWRSPRTLSSIQRRTDSNKPIASLKKFADELGAPVKFVLTPGSGHHLSLDLYAAAFPDARICIPTGRIDRHNPDLMKIANIEGYTANTVPPELAAAGLDVLVWEGRGEGMWEGMWEGKWEGPISKKFAKMEVHFSYECGDIQPQCFLHRPSGTISNGGHHMWYHDASNAEVLKAPGFVKWILKTLVGVSFDYMQPNKMCTEPGGSYVIFDKAALQKSVNALLGWKVDRMTDFHAGLNSEVETGAHAIFEEALAPVVAGDWDKITWKALA